ncbi:MAG TPA: ribosome-associated translation inhibitor RaiA [Bacteroidia bacterium]|jgi:putative sigma-54 modulation protein|nr:ribosome-associated translation inhibitor RaiA [Bacteroidia bacterium]
MEIRIESPHFTVNGQLQEYVNKKVVKLAHINERLIWSNVLLKLDKSDTDENKVCEIKIHAPKEDLFAKCRCTTFEDAVTETIHALEKQMRKKKTSWQKGKEKIDSNNLPEEME